MRCQLQRRHRAAFTVEGSACTTTSSRSAPGAHSRIWGPYRFASSVLMTLRGAESVSRPSVVNETNRTPAMIHW